MVLRMFAPAFLSLEMKAARWAGFGCFAMENEKRNVGPIYGLMLTAWGIASAIGPLLIARPRVDGNVPRPASRDRRGHGRRRAVSAGRLAAANSRG